MLGLKTISLVLALIIPLYPNLSLLSEGEKELISTQNIKTKKDAINQIEILEKNAEYSKNYKEAINNLEKSLIIQQNFLSEKKDEISNKMIWIGRIYFDNKVYDKAEKIFLEIIRFSKKESIKGDFIAYEYLGNIYEDQGLFEKAELNYKNALYEKEKYLGENHPDLSGNYYLLGYIYKQKNLYKKAEENYLKSLSLKVQKFGPNHREIVTSYINLGNLYLENANFKIAEKYYRKALIIQEKNYKGNDPELAYPLSHLGRLYLKIGLDKKAEEYFLKIIELGEEDKDFLFYRASLNLLGDIYINRGLYNKAEIFYEKSLKTSKDIDSNIFTYRRIGNLYGMLKLFKKAEESYLNALKIISNVYGEKHYYNANIFDNLASLYHIQGLFNKAEEYYLKSLIVNKNTYRESHISVAKNYENLGNLYLDKNLYKKAEKNILMALNIIDNIYGEEHSKSREYYASLGDLYLIMGIPKKGEEAYLKSLQITKNFFGNNTIQLADEYENVGYFFLNQNSYIKAERYFIKSLKLKIKFYGENHPEISYIYKTLGYSYLNQGLYEKAKYYYLKSLKIDEFLFGTNHTTNANNLNTLASINRSQSRFEESAKLYKKGIEKQLLLLQRELPYKSLKERESFIKNIDSEIPYVVYQNALENKSKKEKELALFLRINRQGLLEELEKRQYKLLNSSSELKLFEDIVKLKAQFSLQNISKVNQISLVNEIEKLEKKLFNFLPETSPKIIEIETITKYLNNDAVLIEFQRFTPQKDKYYSGTGMILGKDEKNGKIIIDSIFAKQGGAAKAGLKPGDHIISFNNISTEGLSYKKVLELMRNQKGEFIEIAIKRNNKTKLFKVLKTQKMKSINVDDDRYLSLILKSNGKIAVIDLGKADAIDRLISKALKSSEGGYEDAQDIWDQISYKIFNPLKHILGNKEILYISPDSEINKISFSTLRSPKNNKKFITEDYKIRLLTTGRDLLNLKKEKNSINNSFVFANPDFEKNISLSSKNNIKEMNSISKRSYNLESINWPNLPGTETEGKKIASLINAKLFMGNQATSEKIKNLKNFKILHIASHSYYLNDQQKLLTNIGPFSKLDQKKDLRILNNFNENPLLRSGIVLAGANNPKIRNNLDDGYLTALEITNNDWEKSELVIISGCESGLGEIKSGEGVYGLKRAISVAGAKSSMLSLWKVSDKATAEFMESFYLKLKNGEGRAEALANTQKEFRKHPIEAWRHPNVWAAFQLSGDWRPIDF